MLPIPPILERGEALGGAYAISARVAGGYLDELDGPALRVVLPSLWVALDAMRQVDLAGTTGYGNWGADGQAPHSSWKAALQEVRQDRPTDRIAGWQEGLATSATGPGPFETALAAFETLVEGLPEERALIHRDLLHYNVLVADHRLTAVLDWGDANYGDFLYDVAWLTFWAPWFSQWGGVDFAHEAAQHFAEQGLAVPAWEERLRCYQLHIGLTGQAYCAFAGHWDDLAWTARRTLAVLRGSSRS